MKRLFFIFIVAALASCGNSQAGSPATEGEGSVVYFTDNISPESLLKIYEALGVRTFGNVGVKLHMGEPGGTNYLKPELVADFVRSINGTFIDANTAYGGRRSTAEDHYRVAEEHGFSAIGPVRILDEASETSLPVDGGKHLDEVLVGSGFTDYDFIVVLTHFKGHAMGGFGGAIKNMSIGIASIAGKCLIHTAGASTTNAFARVEQDDFLEAMAEGAKGIADHCGDNIIYINVMNNLSVDCDCDSHPEPPRIPDIGILASLDPVALDQACVDLVYESPDEERIHLVERIESRNGIHTLEHAEDIGLGSRRYELVNLD